MTEQTHLLIDADSIDENLIDNPIVSDFVLTRQNQDSLKYIFRNDKTLTLLQFEGFECTLTKYISSKSYQKAI